MTTTNVPLKKYECTKGVLWASEQTTTDAGGRSGVLHLRRGEGGIREGVRFVARFYA